MCPCSLSSFTPGERDSSVTWGHDVSITTATEIERQQRIETGEDVIRRLRACADDIADDVRSMRRQAPGYCQHRRLVAVAAFVPAAAFLSWLGVALTS